jgi:hypothetical protein
MHDSGLENDTVIGLAHDLLLGKKKLIGNTRNNSYCLVVDTTDILKAYPYFWKTMHREIPQKFREALPSEIPNYGWLKPNGDYFGVSWGKHEVWAFEYIREHFKNNMLAGISESSGDFLMKKGWVLLHSPAQTVPVITHTKALTKRQKEFLSGYFMQKGMPGQVRAIWEV